MSEPEKTADGKGCCDKSKCCGGKALAALALLVVGGLGGFCAARHCAAKCAVPAASAPAAQTPAK